MFETILVPVDGSEEGWQAMGQAVEVARREEGAGLLRGLYVVDTTLTITAYDYLALEAAQVEEALSKEAQAVLAEFGRRATAAGVRAETELAEGEPGRVICERAGLADLVVLGRHGAGGAVARLLFGSTFEAVVRHSPRPVMVAVGPARPVRHVLLAYDGSDRANDALALVARAARSRGGGHHCDQRGRAGPNLSGHARRRGRVPPRARSRTGAAHAPRGAPGSGHLTGGGAAGGRSDRARGLRAQSFPGGAVRPHGG